MYVVLPQSTLSVLLTMQYCIRPVCHSHATRSSADADKPARCVCRSVKVTKHTTIQYAGYSFLSGNTNFVCTIFDFQKCRDLEIG